MAKSRERKDLVRLRATLRERAAVERMALRVATEDMQDASDRMVGVATVVVAVARRFWAPALALAATGLFRRAGPMLRLARAGLTVWQVAKMVRDARR